MNNNNIKMSKKFGKQATMISTGVTQNYIKIQDNKNIYNVVSQGVTMLNDKKIEENYSRQYSTNIRNKKNNVYITTLNKGYIKSLKIKSVRNKPSDSKTLYVIGLSSSLKGEIIEKLCEPTLLKDLDYTYNNDILINNNRYLMCKIISDSGVNSDNGSIITDMSGVYVYYKKQE